ncbi:hypothetical protein IKG29_01125 [Candidatus Saccharibacteria bacterium]|nr:hypothetical protein [Candidatus Saccharibacteria bacterium]
MSKYFSKITIATLVASLTMAVGVSAVGNDVLTLEAEQDETTGEITFSGTTDEGVIAVSCSLTDKTGEEVFFGSTEVDAATFQGTFVMPVDGYSLSCANYDGGDWVSITIGDFNEDEELVEEEEEEESNSPDTGELTNEEGASAAVLPLITFASVMLVILVAGVVITKRNKTN